MALTIVSLRAGQAKAMVNNSELSQIKKNKATIYIGWKLKVKNISKPLENINIKFIHDITD